jgi:branched-chain amino acid transport system permease protein
MAVDTTSAALARLQSGPPAEDPRVRWRPSTAGATARIVVFSLVVGALLVVPLVIPEVFVNVYTRAVVYGIVALSLNVLIGYTGQISLGHQAFFGVGAFASGYVITNLGLPWMAGVVVAMALGVVTALLLGGIALRVKGLYLALVTITFGLFAERVIFQIPAVTGGGAGMPAARPTFATGSVAYAYLCFAVLVAVWLFDWRLTSSKAGRAIEALRDDERVAASWGISVTGYKLLAFVISGAMAGLAGALFASIQEIVSPITFSFTLALTFVLMTVVGGVRSRPGVVIGGFVFATLGTILGQVGEAIGGNELAEQLESLVPVIGAVLLLLTLIAFPGGIAEQLRPVLRWLSFGKFHEEESEGTGGAPSSAGARP